MRIYKIVIITILLLNSSIWGQLFSFSVNIDGKPSQQMIRGLNKGNNLLISIEDFSSSLGFKYNFDSETLREEIDFEESKIYVTAFNPFLFYIDSKGDRISYQLSIETIYKYNLIFIPLNSFAEFLNKYTNYSVSYDQKNFLLFIQTSKKNLTTQYESNKSQLDSIQAKKYSQIEIDSSTRFVTIQNFDLYDYKIEEKSNGYIFRIKSRKKIDRLSKNYSNKTLFVQIKNVTIDTLKFNSLIENSVIEKIESIQQKNSVKLNLKFRYDIKSNEIVRNPMNDILILLHVAPETLQKIKKENEERQELSNKKAALDVIVIDAGHGGMDPGAIGLRGTKEKDINLAIALKLGELINKNHKDIKVVQTRNGDEFVELYKRGQIANKNLGKLFISIHCNSTDEKPGKKNGFEVYLLRPGKTEDAIKIAERENSVIKFEENYREKYKHMSDELFLLTNLSQIAAVRHSEKFAEILNKKMKKTLPLKSNGVKQAGFYVLVGASMPSVLIEIGYINHPEDELFLRSHSGQQLITESIYEAIIEFKNFYEGLALK